MSRAGRHWNQAFSHQQAHGLAGLAHDALRLALQFPGAPREASDALLLRLEARCHRHPGEGVPLHSRQDVVVADAARPREPRQFARDRRPHLVRDGPGAHVEGAATPGEYQMAKSSKERIGHLGSVCIFPL
jgi:hypothetical protein